MNTRLDDAYLVYDTLRRDVAWRGRADLSEAASAASALGVPLTRPLWDELANLTNDERVLPSTVAGFLVAMASAIRPKRVLNLWCGDGALASTLAEALPTAELTAVEPLGTALDVARYFDTERRIRWILGRPRNVVDELTSGQDCFDLLVSTAPWGVRPERYEFVRTEPMPKHEYGDPGHYLQQKVVERVLIWVAPLAFIAIIFVSAAVSRPPLPVQLVILALGVAVLVGWRTWDRKAAAAIDPWVKGRDGELDVADALREALGDDCYVIHDIDFGKGNVDHVVVAPSGVYSVETKASGRQVKTQGDRLIVDRYDHTKELKQAFAEAMTVHDYLRRVSGGQDHYVTPLLVYTNAFVKSHGRCRGVYVLNLGRLTHFVSYNRQRLDAKKRSAIAAALGQKVTTAID